MDYRNIDEDWLIKELRKKLPSFDYPDQHRQYVNYANQLASPESQDQMIGAMFGVTAPIGDLTKLAIGHPDLKSASIKALEDALDQIRNRNVGKKLDIDTATGSIRDEIARRNAVSMLGLPETNTAMDRAKAMGYTQHSYHGTPYGGEIHSFGNKELQGRSTGAKSAKLADWSVDNPQVADLYANQIPDDVAKNKDAFIKQYEENSDVYKEMNRYLDEANKKFNAYMDDAKAKGVEFFKAYNEYKRKPEVIESDKVFDQILNQRADVIDKAHELWGEIDPVRQAIYPLKVEDATTFTSQQSESLKKLNDLISSKARPKEIGNEISKLPTVYNAKGATFDEVPLGLSDKLLKAPEGTRVYRFHNLADPAPAATHYAIMNPTAVRSRFAAFDPARRNESDLLASIAAGSLSVQALLDLLNEEQY